MKNIKRKFNDFCENGGGVLTLYLCFTLIIVVLAIIQAYPLIKAKKQVNCEQIKK